MHATLPKNAIDCGPVFVGFRDAAGNITHVHRDELNTELVSLYSDREALAAFNESMEDFADGRVEKYEF